MASISSIRISGVSVARALCLSVRPQSHRIRILRRNLPTLRRAVPRKRSLAIANNRRPHQSPVVQFSQQQHQQRQRQQAQRRLVRLAQMVRSASRCPHWRSPAEPAELQTASPVTRRRINVLPPICAIASIVRARTRCVSSSFRRSARPTRTASCGSATRSAATFSAQAAVWRVWPSH